LLVNDMGAQLQGQAGKGRTGRAMVDAIDAVALPDDGLHLGGRLAHGHPAVVVGHVDDGRTQRRVIRRRLPGRVLEGKQANRHARRRPQVGRGPRDEREPGDRSARAEADERSRLLPPRLARALHGLTSFLTTLEAALPGTSAMRGWLR
jgi:hypothetical protein